MSDLRQSSKYAKYLKSLGWKIEYTDNTYIYLKHIPILGWFIKIQHPKTISKKTLDFINLRYHPFQFSIEPLSNKNISLLTKDKFMLKNSPSLPTKTLIIYLRKSEKELLKSFSQKTRYNIILSQKKNIEIIESKNILDFTKFWRSNFEKNRFLFLSQQKNIHRLYDSFGNDSHLLLAKKNNKIIAVLFLIKHNKNMYYMYAASNNEGRKNYAPTLLTWKALLLAKKLKCGSFDFDGIYDERFPISSWLGFTKFKKGFDGEEIEYPGYFVKSKFNI